MDRQLELFDDVNLSQNELDNALIVMHNQLARKQTKWSARETKLFYSALSQIRWRDNDNWVKLKKADVVEKLGIDSRDTNKLRDMFISVMKKSLIQFDGPTEEEWHDGFLITQVKSDRKNVYVQFQEVYLPLLDKLEAHFTMFHLENIVRFKSKYAIILFQNLKSRYNPKGIINHWKYSLEELKRMFELQEGDYIRKTGRNKGKFDTANFKKKTLDKAVEEINKDVTQSGMCVENITVIKHRGMVVGYDIAFSLIDEDGFRK